MKTILNLSVVLVLFSLSSCAKKDDKDSLTPLFASCDIYDVSQDDQECIEFYEGFTGDSEQLCDDAQDRNIASIKSHRDKDSATRCSSADRTGTCKLTNYTIFFYRDGYTAGAAQTECNTLSGEFE